MSAITNALTLSTLVFNMLYSDKTGSARQEVSRGVNIPTKLLVRHQDVVDSATKLPATRSSVRFEYHMALTGGAIAPAVTATLTVQSLKDPLVTGAIVDSTVELVAQLIQEDDSGLDLATEIFVEKQQ
jgi:hypothetical protein